MAPPLRVYVPGLREGSLELPSEAAHYLLKVQRVREGQSFVAFDPEAALEADARARIGGRGSVVAEIAALRPAARTGALGVSLLQAAGKGDKLEEVVRAATALGVARIQIVLTERSVAVPSARRPGRLRSIAIDAARQSGRGDIPRLEGPTPLNAVLGESLSGVRLVLHPRATQPLHTRLTDWRPGAPVSLLVGPEGGFSENELLEIERAGFAPAALGALTLRTELAGIAALGCFAARLPGELDPG